MVGSPIVASLGRRPRRKRAGRYHHGDLRRALIEQALRTIGREGVEGLTLRAVGQSLGVSRTALYRHFSDKQALLAAVSCEGFRTLRLALLDAWEHGGRDAAAFEAMGRAYVQFAVGQPSHYRVMFGHFDESCERDPELIEEATGAFHVLVDALVHQQRQGLVRHDDPIVMARFIWALTHGISMLVIDGQLRDVDEAGVALNQYAAERVRVAITRSAD